jgi:hypothetical protein
MVGQFQEVGHDSLSCEVDEVVDRQGFAAGQPPAHGGQQFQSTRVVRHAGAKGCLLQQQDRIQVGQLVAEKLPDPLERQAEVFQGEHLVKADHLVGSVGAPSGAGAHRIYQPKRLVEAQGFGAYLEPARGLCRAEETLAHGQYLSSTQSCFEFVPGAGSRGFFSAGPPGPKRRDI